MNKPITTRLVALLSVLLCLSSATCLAEKMVVVNAKGQLLDLESEKVKALTKEKLRVSAIKKRVLEKNLLPEEMVQQIFEPIVEPNKKQYEQNVRNASKFKEMARKAADSNQRENAQKYMQVAKLFYEYSLQNKKIVTSFATGASSEIGKACEDILKLEKEIKQMLRREVPRKWLTPQEVQSVTIMTKKQFDAMQKAKLAEEVRKRPPREGE